MCDLPEMPRYFRNNLPDDSLARGGIPAPRLRALAREHVTALATVLAAQPTPSKPSVYAGAAGIAYSLWRAVHAACFPSAAQEELLGVAAGLARSALATIQRQPPQRHGCSLLAGHAGVYCIGALVLRSCALLAERQGEQALAADLFVEEQQCVQQFAGLHSLACGCNEDEVLYGRAGYLLGCLRLNRARPASISAVAIQQVVQAMIESGECPACVLPARSSLHSLGEVTCTICRQEPGARLPIDPHPSSLHVASGGWGFALPGRCTWPDG